MRKLNTIAERAVKRVAKLPAYRRELTWIDYRDGIDPRTVEKVLRDGYDDDVDEWLSESQREGSLHLADELFEEEATKAEREAYDAEWHDSEARMWLAETVRDYDTSDPYADLLRSSGHILFRYSPDEDDMVWLSDELDSPEATLEALGLDPSFLPAVAQILPEIAGYKWEGGGCFGATFVFRCDPSDVLRCPTDKIVVRDPFLWLTNPWSGNGYGEVAEDCTVTLNKADVHVDKCAWGYGADDVFGGLLLSDSTVTAVELPDLEVNT